MNMVVDAWLERRQPRLKVIDGDSRAVLLDLQGEDLETVLDRSGFAFCDLICANPICQMEVAQSLMKEALRPVAAPTSRELDIDEKCMARLAGVSHELKAPLNAILGYAQLLKHDPRGGLADFQSAYVEQIMRAGHHLQEMLEDELDLARLRSDNLALDIVPVGVAELLWECLDLMRPEAARRSITIEDAHLGHKTTARVWADRRRLRQVLINLVSNAIKFNHDGGEITVNIHPVDGFAMRVEIADSGIGIDEPDMNKLFRPFIRLNENIPGSGLGLVTARNMVEAMNGRMDCESRPGEGSRFWIELPRLDVKQEAYELTFRPAVSPLPPD